VVPSKADPFAGPRYEKCIRSRPARSGRGGDWASGGTIPKHEYVSSGGVNGIPKGVGVFGQKANKAFAPPPGFGLMAADQDGGPPGLWDQPFMAPRGWTRPLPRDSSADSRQKLQFPPKLVPAGGKPSRQGIPPIVLARTSVRGGFPLAARLRKIRIYPTSELHRPDTFQRGIFIVRHTSFQGKKNSWRQLVTSVPRTGKFSATSK